MSIIGSGNALLLASAAPAAAVTGVSRSLRFNSADSAYLNRTPSSAGNRKTWTWSGWVKRTALAANSIVYSAVQDGNNGTIFYFDTNDQLVFFNFVSGGYAGRRTTTPVYRDPSSWYHIVLVWDSANATTSSRIRIYVNNSEVVDFSTSTDPSSADSIVNSTNAHYIGADVGFNNFYSNHYLADVYFVDGQALSPSDFAETDATTGQWVPKEEYTGSYGTNGFHLTFSDNSGTSSTTLGKDAAGSNNWTPNNFSVASGSGDDSLVDVPLNGDQTDTGSGNEVRGNYCTLNPLAKGPNTTLSNGNLEQTTTSSGGCVLGTFGMSSGKWYWEALNGTSGNNGGYGIALSDIDLSGYPGQQANAWSYIYDGNKYNNNSGASYGSSFTAGDIIGVAFDADNGTLTFYKNGVSQGTAFTGLTSGPYLPLMGAAPSYSAANFGQRAWAYSAPSGYKALCTTNLTDPTITDPSDYMDVALYTGNGSTQSITGLGFSPDFVWLKQRSGATSHTLHDTIRGTQLEIYSNSSSQEYSQPNGITAFNSDGFTLGNQSYYNGSGLTFVAWTWDAGSSTASNTDGSITSSVRANASAGFSIVTWTGTGSSATIGHGLNATPGLILCKDRGSNNWVTQHAPLGQQYLVLNMTLGANTDSNIWSAASTSSTFSVGSGSNVNGSSRTYVAYCWAPVAGYSAFGSYTGNGSTDGPFVYTGFRPRFLLIKRTDSTSDWWIWDTARTPYNVSNTVLYPNTTDSDTTISGVFDIDILSNGFKLRMGNYNPNASSGTLVWAAFAEHPFKFANAR